MRGRIGEVVAWFRIRSRLGILERKGGEYDHDARERWGTRAPMGGGVKSPRRRSGPWELRRGRCRYRPQDARGSGLVHRPWEGCAARVRDREVRPPHTGEEGPVRSRACPGRRSPPASLDSGVGDLPLLCPFFLHGPRGGGEADGECVWETKTCRQPIGQYGFSTLVVDTEGNMIGLHSMQ